jgi:integrase
VDSIYFDPISCRVKKNSSGFEGKTKVLYNVINGRLVDIEKAVKDIFQGSSVKPSKEAIKSLLDKVCQKYEETEQQEPENNFFPAFQKYIDTCNLSGARKKHVTSTMNHWKRFQVEKKWKFTFENITSDLLHDFEKYLMERSTRPRARNSEEQVLSPKSKNTVHSIMKMTRAFWNDARKKKITTNYPFEEYTVPAEVYGTPIYITKEERNMIFNAKINDARLDKVRDIFVFQCLIGARVGDLCKLTKANINNGQLSYIPRKGKDGKPVTVKVPLSKKAKEILAKYNLPGNMLLPFISDQRYNDYLKELFKLDCIQLDRMVSRLNPHTREPEQVKLCDIASSHLARRTFVGNLYGKVELGVIKSMSGHAEGSRAFDRYHDVSPELQKEAIDLID